MDVGIDIQKNNAFKDFKKNKRFYENIFCPEEIEICLKKKGYKECFCGKFCVKEAVIKVFNKKLSFKDIKILNDSSGKPYVVIKGKKRGDVCISVSHSKGICAGVAIRT
jgi:holo-[acyl-carrier protein] synthase